MKHILFLSIIFSAGITSAQNETTTNFRLEKIDNIIRGGLGSTYFYNPRREVKVTEYLFDNWDNSAVITNNENHNFLFKNVNININQNVIQAKIARDSVFDFNLNDIKHIVINSKMYKNIYSSEGKRIYEIIYESDKFSIIKGFESVVIAASINPMVNHVLKEKSVRRETYYLKSDLQTLPFRLSKSKVLKLFANDPERAIEINALMKSRRLSYKKEGDLKKVLILTEK